MKCDWRTVLAAMATTIAVSVFAVTLARSVWYAPNESMQTATVSSHIKETAEKDSAETIATLATSSPPDRLRIPALAIDAAVQHVGVKENGNMATPSGFKDVGWYKYGTVPGQQGSAVITGHVDNGLGLAGVFRDLEKIKTGEEVYVKTKDGGEARFVVTDIQTYAYTAVPLDLLFNRHDKARLNLITCTGNWIKKEKTYDARLVVYLEYKK